MGRDGADTGGYLAAIVASLLTAAMALMVPRLAYHIVGGTLENLIVSGWFFAMALERQATRPGVRDAVQGVVGGPVRNRDGTTEWRPGAPQRLATALGSAVVNVLRPASIDPVASAGAVGGRGEAPAVNPPATAPGTVGPNEPVPPASAGSGSINSGNQGPNPPSHVPGKTGR
jgi:hypothetical protein